ncbi:MAG: AtpZ/AtpI family protein [Bryobacteraceae bacterium]
MPKQNQNVWSQVSRYTGLAFILPVSTVAGWVIGHLLDKLFKTNFLYLVFILLGAAAGFIDLIRTTRQEVQRDDG